MAMALREALVGLEGRWLACQVGILDDSQALYNMVYPLSELQSIQGLVGCQRGALALVRQQAILSHQPRSCVLSGSCLEDRAGASEGALPELRLRHLASGLDSLPHPRRLRAGGGS